MYTKGMCKNLKKYFSDSDDQTIHRVRRSFHIFIYESTAKFPPNWSHSTLRKRHSQFGQIFRRRIIPTGGESGRKIANGICMGSTNGGLIAREKWRSRKLNSVSLRSLFMGWFDFFLFFFIPESQSNSDVIWIVFCMICELIGSSWTVFRFRRICVRCLNVNVWFWF